MNHELPSIRRLAITITLAFATMTAAGSAAAAKPNIIVVMGDDIGWFNFGAYHRGIMAGRTPNVDKIAAEGIMFTDYYAEASCTAGRANFIIAQIPAARTNKRAIAVRQGPKRQFSWGLSATS